MSHEAEPEDDTRGLPVEFGCGVSSLAHSVAIYGARDFGITPWQ